MFVLYCMCFLIQRKRKVVKQNLIYRNLRKEEKRKCE